MTQIELIAQGLHGCITVDIKYPPIPNINYNFVLNFYLYLQEVPSMTYRKVHQKKFYLPQQKIKIDGLEGNKMYKIQCKYKMGGAEEKSKSMFTFLAMNEPQEQNEDSQVQLGDFARDNIRNYFQIYERDRENDAKSMKKEGIKNENFSNSQMLLKMIGQSSRVAPKKTLEKFILNGRNCRNVSQFINQKSGKLQDRHSVMQRRQLLINGMTMFSQIYDKRQGMKFFKNDWNMGPFYSYDANEEGIKKK